MSMTTITTAELPVASLPLNGTEEPIANQNGDTVRVPSGAFVTTPQLLAAISTAVNELVNSAPLLLNTIKELADALGDDPNFATTMATALSNKQPMNAALTAIALLSTTSYGRSVLTMADPSAVQVWAGLGNAATRAVGTTAGTVMAGDDSRVTSGGSGYSELTVRKERLFRRRLEPAPTVGNGVTWILARVTSLADSGVGTYRSFMESPDPNWIIFDISGTVRLESPVAVGNAAKVIDGSGADVRIYHQETQWNGTALGNVTTNAIFHNVGLGHTESTGSGQLRFVQGITGQVWVDHVHFFDSADNPFTFGWAWRGPLKGLISHCLFGDQVDGNVITGHTLDGAGGKTSQYGLNGDPYPPYNGDFTADGLPASAGTWWGDELCGDNVEVLHYRCWSYAGYDRIWKAQFGKSWVINSLVTEWGRLDDPALWAIRPANGGHLGCFGTFFEPRTTPGASLMGVSLPAGGQLPVWARSPVNYFLDIKAAPSATVTTVAAGGPTTLPSTPLLIKRNNTVRQVTGIAPNAGDYDFTSASFGNTVIGKSVLVFTPLVSGIVGSGPTGTTMTITGLPPGVTLKKFFNGCGIVAISPDGLSRGRPAQILGVTSATTVKTTAVSGSNTPVAGDTVHIFPSTSNYRTVATVTLDDSTGGSAPVAATIASGTVDKSFPVIDLRCLSGSGTFTLNVEGTALGPFAQTVTRADIETAVATVVGAPQIRVIDINGSISSTKALNDVHGPLRLVFTGTYAGAAHPTVTVSGLTSTLKVYAFTGEGKLADGVTPDGKRWRMVTTTTSIITSAVKWLQFVTATPAVNVQIRDYVTADVDPVTAGTQAGVLLHVTGNPALAGVACEIRNPGLAWPDWDIPRVNGDKTLKESIMANAGPRVS